MMPTPEPSRDEALAALERDRRMRSDRRAMRQARQRATGIKALNLVAMMTMMTVLLVILLKLHQTSTLSLDTSGGRAFPVTSTQWARQENISITVSMHEVAVNNSKVVPLTAGVIPSASKEGGKAEAFLVGGIFDAIKQEVARQKEIAQRDQNAPVNGRLTVIADKQVPYRTLMEVLYTAGQAGLSEYQFLVMNSE